MERPTKEQVDVALLCAEGKDSEVAKGIPFEKFYSMPDVLAAEVRALREQIKAERESTAVMWGRDVHALKEAADIVLRCWSDFTSQEMYGEMLREGMANQGDECGSDDFDRWEEAHTKLREARGEP